jgi:CheY-like chemotaxis protein
MVERILRNLLGNALRYTEAGTVLLACRPLGEQLRVQVWDTGIGIAETDRERIFEEFHQIKPKESLRGQAGGMGLGLSIARRMTHLLGTTLTVRSVPGHGSVFEFRLPRSVTGVVEPPAGLSELRTSNWDADSAGPFLAGLRVIVLEDDVLGRQMLVDTLVAWGADVLAFGDIAELRALLDRAATWPFALVLDYQIGSDTSDAVIEQVRRQQAANPARVPTRIVVISGVQDSALPARLEARDVLALPKPVSLARLRDALRN